MMIHLCIFVVFNYWWRGGICDDGGMTRGFGVHGGGECIALVTVIDFRSPLLIYFNLIILDLRCSERSKRSL